VASERRTSGIVTPEAVLLEFETAGVASRCFARLIDAVVQGALVSMAVAAVALVLTLAGQDEPGLMIAAVAVASFAGLFGYPVALETLWGGRTLGKALLGLRVVTREGAPARFRHAAVRAVVGFVEVLALPFVAVLTTALSPANQRMGDLAAGTIVVRERSASHAALALAFPPPRGWEHYVRTLDVSVMTAEQYRIARSYLTRVLTLTPAARGGIAVRLANPLATAMRHRPPTQLSPELFLVCAVAAYQVRHGAPGVVVAPPPAWVAAGPAPAPARPASRGLADRPPPPLSWTPVSRAPDPSSWSARPGAAAGAAPPPAPADPWDRPAGGRQP
jgi:uncharacterized RDD family membrane protein YckC